VRDGHKSEPDEQEMERRRITAAAFGFASWEEFRTWRRRSPAEYRQSARRFLYEKSEERNEGIVVDLFLSRPH
jgi:hypothetical protein